MLKLLVKHCFNRQALPHQGFVVKQHLFPLEYSSVTYRKELYGKQFSPVRFYKCTSDGVCNDDAEVWMEFVHPIQKLSISVKCEFCSCLISVAIIWVTSIPSKLIGSPWEHYCCDTAIYFSSLYNDDVSWSCDNKLWTIWYTTAV